MSTTSRVRELSICAILIASSVATAGDCIPANGTAVAFDGNDWIDFGSGAPVFQHTIEAWVRPTSLSGLTTMAGHFAGPGTNCGIGMGFQMNSGFFSYHVDISGCGNGARINSVGPAVLGEWAHLAGTYDGNAMRFYVNGQLAGEALGIPFNASNYMAAGAVLFANGPQGFYPGDLDELRIWNIARTESEIVASMNFRLIGRESGLVGLWHFDEGSGQEALESIPSCRTGVFGGSSTPGEADDPTWVPGAPLCLIQTDVDGDGVIDGLDNCILEPNLDQLDSDGDGFGNACDGDLNGDLFVNNLDLGMFRLAFFSTPAGQDWNPDADFNNDLQINVIDLGILKLLFFAEPGPSAIANVCD